MGTSRAPPAVAGGGAPCGGDLQAWRRCTCCGRSVRLADLQNAQAEEEALVGARQQCHDLVVRRETRMRSLLGELLLRMTRDRELEDRGIYGRLPGQQR